MSAKGKAMARKIRELKAMLRKAGFTCRSGKGSHSVWDHPKASGNDGRDAKPYQEREVGARIAEVQK